MKSNEVIFLTLVGAWGVISHCRVKRWLVNIQYISIFKACVYKYYIKFAIEIHKISYTARASISTGHSTCTKSMDHGEDEGKSELAEEAEGPFAEISRTDTELRSGRKNTSSATGT